MKRRYKASMRGRRIVSVFIFIIVIILLVGLIVNVVKGGKEEDISKKAGQNSGDVSSTQKSGGSEGKTTEKNDGKTDSPTKKTPTKAIEFETADAAYAENHKYCVAINRQQNVVTVYEKDSDGKFTKPVKAMLCSCGKTGGDDTPAGTFKTTDKVRWLWLVNNTYGQYTIRINSHIWFHSVPYEAQDPSKLEYEEYNKLGQNASLGCVRLNVRDAKWLYDNLDWNTIVVVYDSEDPGPLGKPEGKKIDVNSANRGWDPTDPDASNPWNA